MKHRKINSGRKLRNGDGSQGMAWPYFLRLLQWLMAEKGVTH
jgi:hypothetical protein